jgi:hypothetical protein
MQYMQKMQGNLVRKRVPIIFNQMDKERSKYKQKMVHFLEVFASFPGCYHHRQRPFVECTCLKQLVDFDHAADFLVNVGMMNKGEQESAVKEWILGRNATRGGGVSYSSRIGSDATTNYEFPVFRLAFLDLLHLVASRWYTLNTTKLIPGPNSHGNEGNNTRVTSLALSASRDSLILYFKETGERHGDPHATRCIRMKAGM